MAAAHVFVEPGDYTVTLTITDDAGVGNSTVSLDRLVTVNPAPAVGLSVSNQMCPGVPFDWSVKADADTTVTWQFGDDTEATGMTASHSFAAPGLYPVAVALDDGRGMLNSTRREEVYARVNAAPMAVAGPDQLLQRRRVGRSGWRDCRL